MDKKLEPKTWASVKFYHEESDTWLRGYFEGIHTCKNCEIFHIRAKIPGLKESEGSTDGIWSIPKEEFYTKYKGEVLDNGIECIGKKVPSCKKQEP